MRTIFTTFCATSLLWSLGLLYCFTSGNIARHESEAINAIYEPAQPVKLARR